MEKLPPNFVTVDSSAATFPLSELPGLTGTITIGTPASI